MDQRNLLLILLQLSDERRKKSLFDDQIIFNPTEAFPRLEIKAGHFFQRAERDGVSAPLDLFSSLDR